MENTKIIDLPYISGMEELPTDYIKRDAILNQIDKALALNDIIFICGDEGIGKTTILTDFVLQNSQNTISFFVNEFDKYTYSFDCMLDRLYSQIYFYNKGDITEVSPDLNLYNSVQGDLRKKIKSKRKSMFFVFDGLDNLTSKELDQIIPLIEILPWKSAKFIFSGKKDLFNRFYSQKLNCASLDIYNFGLHETKEYFKGICSDDSELLEIHKLSKKGIPSKLKELKLLCNNNGGVANFLKTDDLSEKTNYLEKIWDDVDENNDVLNKIIALIVFSDIDLKLTSICEILGIEKKVLEENIKEVTFIKIIDERIIFQVDTIRSFSKNKLKKLEGNINNLLIDYYELKQDSEESMFNLPHLYSKAKQWEKITQFFTTDAFIHFIDKYQTIVNINSHFSIAYNASKNTKIKFDEARLRFALHKSSIIGLEKHELWESEIEARVLLGDYDQSLTLANSALLKEDRLKLLAILAKQRKINNLHEDTDLLDQIKSLYEQIDFSDIRNKGFEIAGILIYSNLQLAIELVEKVTDNSTTNNSLDYAFAYLTLYATEINKKNKSQIADIDIINAKIQSDDVKNITNALRYLSDEYSIDELFVNVASITKFSQKLFILKNWIKNNRKNKEVTKAIKLTLEEIVRTSSENVPNAISLSEIASPLPFIKNKDEIKELILLFDAHRYTIDRPTKSYVELQLIIAEALLRINFNKAKERIFDIYLLIEELDDLSVKTDCLSFVWLWLSKNDENNSIEKSISSIETIEFQTRKNIDLLLKDTAYHFKMVENVISTIIIANPDFVFETIKKLNTQERRDIAFKLALENYIEKTEVENLDFILIDKFYGEILDLILKEGIIIEIIDKFYYLKEGVIPHIAKITPYYRFVKSLNQVANKCYIICHAIKILNFDKTSHELLIEDLLKELYNSWNEIDVLWEKIEIGFLIARDLTEFSKDKAGEYLGFATGLKHQEAFSSNSIVKTYITSIKLSIMSICGLIIIDEKRSTEISLIFDTINVLQSVGEKLKLWSELYLRIYALGKVDLSKNIFKQYINPLLNEWTSTTTDSYKLFTIIKISPALYTFNSQIFQTDYLEKLNTKSKDKSIKYICDFILTKLCTEDPVSSEQKTVKLEYSEINEICMLINKLDNDFLIHNYIEKLVKCIKESKNDLTIIQKDSLKEKIMLIIKDRLPSRGGIQHEGYKIVSESEILSLDNYTGNESLWNNLIARADLISNISDRALILVMLANKITQKSNKKQIELMEKAFDLIKLIPSVYDKTNRFDATWETWLNIDKSKFKKYLKLAYKDLLNAKDGEISGIKSIIDMAHQHDSQLTDELITMLDDDPARKKLKKPFVRSIESKTLINKACKESSMLATLDNSQYQDVFRKNLMDLNNGKKVSKDIAETFDILDKSSGLSLNDAYESYMYFIQNAIKRYEVNSKEKDILSSIFSSTIENTKLIGILSSDNISKMKNLYKTKRSVDINPIISPGERTKAVEILKKWFGKNIDCQLIIIDPYFTEKELNILQLIQEVKADCEVKILTSKTKSKNNNYLNERGKSINKEVYIGEWKKISSDDPLPTIVKIVWDKDTFDTPIHDRWIIEPHAKLGLKLGTSYNGFGNKESSIEVLNTESLLNVQEIIDKYLYKEVRKIGGFNLKYESFDLED
jgi:hypothetical protein